MNLFFSDESCLKIDLYPPVKLQQTIEFWFKHLKKVRIPWRPWDYHFYNDLYTIEEIKNNFVESAYQIGISLDKTKLHQQLYLNELHTTYEKNYNGDQLWSDYHEQLHLIENYIDKFYTPSIWINYRHLSGPLNKKFNFDLLDYSTQKLNKGTVFLGWDELGKTPLNYFINSEPDNFERLCQLCKPWKTLAPKIIIALEAYEDITYIEQALFLHDKTVEDFKKWWAKYETDWCIYWDIPRWSLTEITSYIPIGYCSSTDLIREKLNSNVHPSFLTI